MPAAAFWVCSWKHSAWKFFFFHSPSCWFPGRVMQPYMTEICSTIHVLLLDNMIHHTINMRNIYIYNFLICERLQVLRKTQQRLPLSDAWIDMAKVDGSYIPECYARIWQVGKLTVSLSRAIDDQGLVFGVSHNYCTVKVNMLEEAEVEIMIFEWLLRCCWFYDVSVEFCRRLLPYHVCVIAALKVFTQFCADQFDMWEQKHEVSATASFRTEAMTKTRICEMPCKGEHNKGGPIRRKEQHCRTDCRGMHWKETIPSTSQPISHQHPPSEAEPQNEASFKPSLPPLPCPRPTLPWSNKVACAFCVSTWCPLSKMGIDSCT